MGQHYDPESISIHWEGTVEPGETARAFFLVQVDPDTPIGTKVTNLAKLEDDALGDEASVTTAVIARKPIPGKDDE